MRRLAYISVLILLLSVSCSHKDIVCPGDDPHRIEVLFEWNKAPQANPEGMTLFFFSEGRSKEVWRFDISGRDGGPVELPPGTYRMIACNNDLPGIVFGDPVGFDSLTASLRNSADGGGTYMPGGMLYGVSVDYIEVTLCGVSYLTAAGTVKECGMGLVRCQPDSLSTVYDVIVRDVDGMERVRSVRGVLRGVDSRLMLGMDNSPVGPAAISFGMSCDADRHTFSASECAFSPGQSFRSYSLDLIVTCADGKVFSKSFDAGDLIVNTFCKRNVVIMIDGLAVPEGEVPDNPGGSVDGIDVGVEGWEVVEVDITAEPDI